MNFLTFIGSKNSPHSLGHPSATQNKSFSLHQGHSYLKRCWNSFYHKYLSQTTFSIDVWYLTFLWSTALWFMSGKEKKNINEHIFYFVATGGVTQNLFWLKLVVSSERPKRNLFSANGNMESRVSPSQSVSSKCASTRPASQFLMQPSVYFPAFPGWLTVSHDLDILHFHYRGMVT